MVATLRAANVTPNARDTLVYKDGDRIQGVLVEKTAQLIVFKSDRFGELRVAAADAVVIKSEATPDEKTAAGERRLRVKPRESQPAKPAAAPVTAAATKEAKKEAAAASEQAEQERATIWDQFSPSVLTARVRNYFGPWNGRVSFSTEIVTDVAERNNSSYEAHLKRKWKKQEVQLNARYDYSETDEVATTDMRKAWGQWRYEFNKQIFAQYRPTSEWNRAAKLRGVKNDYLLLQQEIGAGWHVLTRPTRKIRVGVSQNLFDTWNLTPPNEAHTSRGVQSLFGETDFTLPWRISLTQRGVWYPVGDQKDGWEHRFEVNKKLTETLSHFGATRNPPAQSRRHRPGLRSAEAAVWFRFLERRINPRSSTHTPRPSRSRSRGSGRPATKRVLSRRSAF